MFRGFRPTSGYGFGLVWFVGFPEGLEKEQPSGKPKIQDNKRKQKQLWENQKTKTASGKPKVFKGFRRTLGYGIWYCLLFWFSRRFFVV